MKILDDRQLQELERLAKRAASLRNPEHLKEQRAKAAAMTKDEILKQMESVCKGT